MEPSDWVYLVVFGGGLVWALFEYLPRPWDRSAPPSSPPKPQPPYPGAGKRRIHGQNHPEQYEGVRHHVFRGATGGSVKHRDDRHLPGVLYLVAGLGHIKVGITAQRRGNERLHEHHRHGWTTVATWSTRTLTDARHIERLVLRHWQTLEGATTSLAAHDVPQGGVSETARLSPSQISATKSLIESHLDKIGRLTPHRGPLNAFAAGKFVEVAGVVKRVTPAHAKTTSGGYRHARWLKLEVAGSQGPVTLEVAEAHLGKRRPSSFLGAEIKATGVLELHEGKSLIADPKIQRIRASSTPSPPRSRTTPSTPPSRTTPSTPRPSRGQSSVQGTITAIKPNRGIVIATKEGVVTVTGETRPSLLGLGVQVCVWGDFSGPSNNRTVSNPGWKVIGHSRTAPQKLPTPDANPNPA